MDAPADLDALAQALREDGVVIDRVMGSGDARGAHDRIAALVREVPFPVYVALVRHPAGLPTDNGVDSTEVLTQLLHRRLGDGLYVVDTPEGIQQVVSHGLDANPSRLYLGAGSNADALDEAMQEVGDYSKGTEDYLSVPDVAQAEAQVLAAEELVEMARQPASGHYPVTISQADVEELAREAVDMARTADWRPESDYVEVRAASGGLSALVGGLVGLAVALLVGQSLRGWPRRGKPLPARPQPRALVPPVLETERAKAVALSDELSRELAAFDWSGVRDREVAGRALTARDALEPLLTSDDVADVVGAQVIARAGLHDLLRAMLDSGEPLATCFFDPRHPEVDGAASWRLGDGEVEVPACAACRKDVAKHRTPDHLRVPVRRGSVPYWERDDVWARTGFGAVSDFVARDVLEAREEQR